MNTRTQHYMLLMQDLLTDPDIQASITNGESEKWAIEDINEDYSITLGKTRCRWWNRLLNDEKTISFNDFALNIVNKLVGQKANVNKVILEGLSIEFVNNAVVRHDNETVIDRLFDCARYGVEGPLNSKGFSVGDVNDKKPRGGYQRSMSVRNGLHTVYAPDGEELCTVELGIVSVDGHKII